MKQIKQTLSMMLAVLLLAALTVMPTSAAGSYTIRIETEVEGHTYEVYQIFSGSLNDKGIMTEIGWGSGVSALGQSDLGSAEAKAGTLKTVADAEAFGRQVGEYLENPVATVSTWGDMSNGSKGYEITVPSAGYYLIKDMDGSVDSADHDAYTQYIIQVVGDVNVSPKSSVPTLSKRVSKDKSAGYAAGVSTFISGTVYFELTASMHSHIDNYDSYYMQITDTLPAGLDYDSVVGVYVINGENYTDYDKVDDTYYTPDYDATTKVLTVTIKDAKAAILDATGVEALRDDKIIVCYAAKLNTDAVVGSDPNAASNGNPNKAVLTYSNDPNESYDPTNQDKPAHTGTTPEATATVYTYQLQLTKVDAADNTVVLPGAQFVLYHYKNATTKEYIKVDANGKVEGFTSVESEASKLTTGANGMLSVIGLPSGSYRLKEVVAPSGYNLLTTEIAVTITGTLDASTGKLGTFKGEVTGTAIPPVVTKETGTVMVTVQNRQGSTLPETGGIGTTIFYIAGATLMLGAVAVIVTKKRSESK